MSIKVLSIIDSGIIGGPGRGLFQLINYVDKSRCEFQLANFRYRNPKSTEFIDTVAKMRLPLHLFTQRFLFDPLPFMEIKKIVKEQGIQIIETHNYKGHLLGLYASIFLGVKWVAWAHGWTTEDLKVRIYHALDFITLRFADLAVAVSHPLYEKLKKIRRLHSKTELILNAVDIRFIPGDSDGDIIKKKYELDDNLKIIGVIGRLSSEKGQKYLFEALKLLKDKLKLKLLVIGDGPDRAALENWVKDNGLSQTICFTGYQTHVMPFYSAIDLLVIPSLSEGLPNVLLEAMALKIPVVATDVGEIPEIINDGKNGWVVQRGSITALAAAIEAALIFDPLRERVIEEAKKFVDQNFDPKKRAENVVGLYQSLIEG